MGVSGVRATMAVREAMRAAGLGRTSRLSGGAVAGWIDRNHHGSTGFSVALAEGQGTRWHVVLSGKPHLRYSSRVEEDGMDLHEPVDPGRLHPRIRKAFEGLGMTVREVRTGGWQGHWDDDVDYEVMTDRPAWLGPYDAANADALRSDRPVLATLRLGDAARRAMISSDAVLAGYLDGGRTLLTRESVERLAADVAKANDTLKEARASMRGFAPGPVRSGLVTLRGDRLLWQGSGEAARWEADPVTVTNHWGDEVTAWPVPARRLDPARALRADVDMTVGGETVRELSFETWDAQFGGDAPWSAPEARTMAP